MSHKNTQISNPIHRVGSFSSASGFLAWGTLPSLLPDGFSKSMAILCLTVLRLTWRKNIFPALMNLWPSSQILSPPHPIFMFPMEGCLVLQSLNFMWTTECDTLSTISVCSRNAFLATRVPTEERRRNRKKNQDLYLESHNCNSGSRFQCNQKRVAPERREQRVFKRERKKGGVRANCLHFDWLNISVWSNETM